MTRDEKGVLIRLLGARAGGYAPAWRADYKKTMSRLMAKGYVVNSRRSGYYSNGKWRGGHNHYVLTEKGLCAAAQYAQNIPEDIHRLGRRHQKRLGGAAMRSDNYRCWVFREERR